MQGGTDNVDLERFWKTRATLPLPAGPEPAPDVGLMLPVDMALAGNPAPPPTGGPDGPAVDHDHWGESWSGTGTGLTLTSSDGTGVKGRSNAACGWTYGVYGSNNSTSGRGVYGYTSAATGTTYGVYGLTRAAKGTSVFG